MVAQWRELNSIFNKQDKHVLINYVYDYPKDALYYYTQKVINEFRRRDLRIKSYDNYNEYFERLGGYYIPMGFKEHNNEYLTICYWNLREKYIRGQKDFTDEVWDRLDEFYQKRMKGV